MNIWGALIRPGIPTTQVPAGWPTKNCKEKLAPGNGIHMRDTITKLRHCLSILTFAYFLTPGSVLAASVQCSNEHGTCTVSDEGPDWASCDCEYGSGEGTGGNTWDDLSDAELEVICEDFLLSCGESSSTTGDPTGETEGSTTDPTAGDTEWSTTDPTTGESDGSTTFETTTTTDTGATVTTLESGSTSEDDGTDETACDTESAEEQLEMDVDENENHNSDGVNEDDKVGCSITAGPGSASLLGLGLLLGLTGVRRRRFRR